MVQILFISISLLKCINQETVQKSLKFDLKQLVDDGKPRLNPMKDCCRHGG